MRALPMGHDKARSYPTPQSSNDGILKLPMRLQRDLVVLFVIKLAMLGLLYLLCFAPSHQPAVDVAEQIAGQQLH